MRKLLGQHAATTSETIDTNPNSPQLRPSSSQNTVFKTRASIACLDRSPDRQRAVIAGQKVFKILKVDGSTITEDVDLRAVISSYASSHDPSAATADQLNIRAVKWSYDTLNTTIITACGNGRIAMYDLNRVEEGLEYARIQEHARQVHKLAINPFKCNWLLSASQDGTVKSFDIRAPFMGRNGPTFRTWNTFKCNADAVRDVKWSPTDGMEFACSTDAGVIQKWDMRKPSAPILKITAHQSACFSISWHPDGNHLVSGGMDQHCHVWNVSKTAERGQKPRYSFTTPAPVSIVSWRPACWSATANGNRSAQVTVVYDDTKQAQTPAVHLWDLARPGFPFKEIEQWDSSPTGILWNNSRDILWSVDKEGHFTQTDVAFVPQLIERRSLSTFAFSPAGDVLMLLEERQAPRRPRPPLNSPEVSPSYQHVSNVPLLSVSRSDSEEDVVGSFLGPRKWKKKRHREPNHLLSTTPPSSGGMIDSNIMSLDDSVMVTGLYKPQQIMAIGHAPSTAKRAIYKYFTNRYLARIDGIYSSKATELSSIDERVASTMEYFAETAEIAAHYRLAQTWRLLAYTISLLLLRRAEFHRASRLTVKRPLSKSSVLTPVKDTPLATPRNGGDDTPRRFPRATSPLESPLTHAAKSLKSEEIESTSNVATPLVRPVHDSAVHETRKYTATSRIEDDVLHLSDAAHSPSSKPHPIPGAPRSHSSDRTASSVEGYDFYGMESFTPAIDYVAPPKKQPLRLDYSENSEVAKRMQPKRHDSGESFAMFSTSGESQSGNYMGSVGSDDRDSTRPSSLRDRVSIWENSFSSRPHHRASIDSDVHTMSTDSSDEHRIPSSFEAHCITQKTGPQKTPRPPVFRIQEASFRSAVDNRQDIPTREGSLSPLCASSSNDPHIIESDYLPWNDDPDFVFSPMDPATLVQQAITFETQTGALNASVMILLLRPLLPVGAIDNIQASAILAQYHSRLKSMQLFTEAAILRKLCVPTYPNVFAMAQENINSGYFCTDCHKPLDNDPTVPGSQWQCPRCEQAIEGCAICRHRDADNINYGEDQVQSVLWWYCPGCGHGGHTMCMAEWHGDTNERMPSGGCCPLEGCLHPCLPGPWRGIRAEEKKAAKQRDLDLMVKENSRHGNIRGRGVRPDVREVNQSKAVEGVRVALGITGLERKKSVKIVTPTEQGAS